MPAEYSLLKDEISLGRGEDNDVVIPHASISRAHARLMRRNGVFELMDLNSTNGTYVNEQPVRGSVRVNNGSEVRLGDITFVCGSQLYCDQLRAMAQSVPATCRYAGSSSRLQAQECAQCGVRSR